MKLAFSTLGCPDWSLEKILTAGRDMGFQGVEIRGIQGEMNVKKIPAFFPENQKETLEKFRAHGLSICDFASGVSFHDPEKEAEMTREGLDCIEVCHQMGIPYIRVFGNSVEEADTVEGEVKRIAAGLSRMCRDAEGTDVKILLEVHGNVNTAERLVKIAEMVDSPHFGVVWDVAHSDLGYKENFLAFYEPIKPFIHHVHIKDHKRLPEGGKTLCMVGEGDIPLIPIIRQMEKDGYTGFYSLEWEKKWCAALEDGEIAFPAYVSFMKEHFPAR